MQLGIEYSIFGLVYPNPKPIFNKMSLRNQCSPLIYWTGYCMISGKHFGQWSVTIRLTISNVWKKSPEVRPSQNTQSLESHEPIVLGTTGSFKNYKKLIVKNWNQSNLTGQFLKSFICMNRFFKVDSLKIGL